MVYATVESIKLKKKMCALDRIPFQDFLRWFFAGLVRFGSMTCMICKHTVCKVHIQCMYEHGEPLSATLKVKGSLRKVYAMHMTKSKFSAFTVTTVEVAKASCKRSRDEE